ncbi:hypothetical protein SAMN06265222_102246 [Neorhodopirellula lusitana]|uniref:SPOR domain-containing protein n=1 Tax=Neorhodopirellula lusitana TaxID=445327 RepID=A0ABY1PXY6_9BACT|nr:hypothetical protein [Neorhodopirellula lusitana]SMP47139.1 hypothetical protein SAMN06265222_102246 [Neorhodopirellula lusitana]
MRKRVPIVIGGGVALLVASQYLNFGLGFRDGNGIDGEAEDPALASIEEAIMEAENFTPEITPGSSANESAEMELVPVEPELPDVVDILIDGNQYWIAINASDLNQREAKTIEEILAMISTLEGDASGIRVRIARTPDAVASAEAAILLRLKEAGLPDDAVDSRRQLVER